MSGGDDPKGKPGFETNTPALTQAASQQPGVISIEPLQVQLQNVDGGIQGIATVSALFQEFTVGSVQINGGDQRYSYESECLATGKKLEAGERCNVLVKLNQTTTAGTRAAPQDRT